MSADGASQSSSIGSPASSLPNGFTPERKVKALLAQFSDSESELENAEVEKTRHSQANPAPPLRPQSPIRERSITGRDSSGSEDDILPAMQKSRMAARLLGGSNGVDPVRTSPDHGGPAQQSVEHRMAHPSDDRLQEEEVSHSKTSREDELSTAQPRRRLLLKKTQNSLHVAPARQRASRSGSPMFFPSPSTAREAAPSSHGRGNSDSDDLPDKPLAGSNSKFLALVEKHRRERTAREEAENAKKAARVEEMKKNEQPQIQRGSSPADDTDEDSDASNEGAVKRISEQARPTRKASKKALDEMHRETQRMHRYMQLAHQARTKKKITKGSLLARFNFAVPNISTVESNPVNSRSSTTASAAGSDAEIERLKETPPTSPMLTPEVENAEAKSDLRGLQTAQSVMRLEPLSERRSGSTTEAIDDHGKWYGDHGETAVELPHAPSKSQAEQDPKEMTDGTAKAPIVPSSRRNMKHVRANWTRQDAVMARADDSDSDLEIITSKGATRKYTAFETLPKRKAKETGSHIALRSLAHLAVQGDKGKSINAAEMEASLRRAARLQAQQERHSKIEELKAKGVIVQTAEEREQEQQEVEDLLERARQEAVQIQKREKEVAKRDGTFVKDGLIDDEDSDEDDDGDFQDEEDNQEADVGSGSEDGDEDIDDDDEQDSTVENQNAGLIDAEADEEDSESLSEDEQEPLDFLNDDETGTPAKPTVVPRAPRRMLVVSDDEDEGQAPAKVAESPSLPRQARTPQSLNRSARKVIPGLAMSDDLSLGLTQAFAATMADSQSQDLAATQEQGGRIMTADFPSPDLPFAPRLQHLDSMDIISDSQPASQTQPLNVSLSFSQSQQVPQSPATGLRLVDSQFGASQMPFEPTQDGGYMLSPFTGNRFGADTPNHLPPHSTVDTVILAENVDGSPILQRKGRLMRGSTIINVSQGGMESEMDKSAFEIMRRAAKNKTDESQFDKSKSHAREIVDEAAEESEDEYAGLGGVSDDGEDEENEEDRKMIDEDTQVGRGDEAKLAGLYADRERKQDEAAVSKLLKDITTGALRRKRGVGDELDLSDEEDATVRRREAKRREFAKMRRELLKDEAVGKIAEDRKKEAFLRSIEDREPLDEEDDDFDQPETPLEEESQSQSQHKEPVEAAPATAAALTGKQPLENTTASNLNRMAPSLRRTGTSESRKPSTLAEIRESVSFLIDEPDSQAGTIDLGLSDSEDDAEAYVNLDRHFQAAEADENDDEDDGDDLGDFIVDDDRLAKGGSQDSLFKKPDMPNRKARAPFNERRTNHGNVVDRLHLLRQGSSSSTSSASTGSSSTKMAFYASKSTVETLLNKVPSLLRRATTNSSFGSMAGRDDVVSATGVVTSRTERGDARDEKEFVRKGTGGKRNAVNYVAAASVKDRVTLKDEKMSKRAGVSKKKGKSSAGGFLGGLFRGDSWK